MDDVDFGPVLVRQPKASPRIGYYDDDDYMGRAQRAIVYYCEPPFLTNPKYQLVPLSRLSPVNTEVLWVRRRELQKLMIDLRSGRAGARRSFERLYDFSQELSYVNSLLSDRMINALANEGNVGGKQVFLSYSSKDRAMATALSVDLANEGHRVWLDEWEIKVGESIPNKIALGIDECDYLLVLLSPHSVQSGWVEREWSTKYWAEANSGNLHVIPVLLSDCEIPTLLRVKKYADFRSDYGFGLDKVLGTLGRFG
ncbi:toll/interleukin-1 receptor domain-containing protein [Amycolatopsis japonica]